MEQLEINRTNHGKFRLLCSTQRIRPLHGQLPAGGNLPAPHRLRTPARQQGFRPNAGAAHGRAGAGKMQILLLQHQGALCQRFCPNHRRAVGEAGGRFPRTDDRKDGKKKLLRLAQGGPAATARRTEADTFRAPLAGSAGRELFRRLHRLLCLGIND